MRQLMGAAMMAAGTVAVGAAAPETGALGPQPGDVYREFYVVMGRNREWGVNDPQRENKGALANVPNPVLRLHLSDLGGARRAELLIDRWGGHPGTIGQRIRFNGNGWIPLPQLTTTPPGVNAACYMSQDNPIVPVPLADLKAGVNTLEGTAGYRNLCGALRGWGKWGWYGGILRVYYANSKPHVTGRIVAPGRGRQISENPEIRIETRGAADRVDVLAWYDGYDEDGDGVFENWHGAYHYIDLGHHVGTSTHAPHRVRWDTTWVPDQRPGALKFIARIRGADGVWFVTAPVEGLTLRRQGASVRICRPLNVPERYQVRAGARKRSGVHVPDVGGATDAVVALRTWNGYGESFTFNGHAVEIGGARHNYAFDLRPVPVQALRQGANSIEFHSTTKDHAVEVLWPGPALLVRYGAAAASAPRPRWLNGDYEGRFWVDITADSEIGGEKPVEIPLPAAVRQRSFRVVAYQDGSGPATHNGAVPWQLDADGTLTVLVGSLEAGQSRRLAVYFGKPQGLVPFSRVTVEDEVMHQGQASLRIRSERATYVFHKEGGGFASILDRDGNDWISYRPGNRGAGEFRGIPNLGECFHPGYTGAKGTRTKLEAAGPIKARFRVETIDGRWAATWDIYSTYARMRLDRAGGPYWFLYEGTPGGKLDVPEDFWVTSDGTRRSVADAWGGDLPAPEWVYFADAKAPRALFLANHQDDALPDQFWQLTSDMTVWGFGRKYRGGPTRYLTAAPAYFSIGLLETRDYTQAAEAIRAAMAAPKVVVGPLEFPDRR